MSAAARPGTGALPVPGARSGSATEHERLQNHVGGQRVDPVGRSSFPLVDPATEEVTALSPVSVGADVDRAVDAAEEAFRRWGRATPSARQRMLLDLAAAAEETALDAEGRVRPGYGPLNNARHFAAVSAAVADAPAHATVRTGGHRLGGRGYHYAPTVVTGVRQEDALVQDEVFGPVVTVQPFTGPDEALRLANGVRYGLAASVWTRDHATALRFTRELDAGAVWVNAHIPLEAETPHGGFKSSGYGKDLSTYCLDEYTRVKHVMSAHA